MLVAPAPRSFDELDQRVFQALVPADHYLKKAAAALDFERLRPLAADRYSPGQGRPPSTPSAWSSCFSWSCTTASTTGR